MSPEALLERLRSAAAAVGAGHPLVARLLAFGPAVDAGSGAVHWLVVVDHRDRKAEAGVVRSLEEATPAPAEVFIVDERTYRLRERSERLGATLRRAHVLYARGPSAYAFGRSP
mgnify:CR=1 FL=1